MRQNEHLLGVYVPNPPRPRGRRPCGCTHVRSERVMRWAGWALSSDGPMKAAWRLRSSSDCGIPSSVRAAGRCPTAGCCAGAEGAADSAPAITLAAAWRRFMVGTCGQWTGKHCRNRGRAADCVSATQRQARPHPQPQRIPRLGTGYRRRPARACASAMRGRVKALRRLNGGRVRAGYSGHATVSRASSAEAARVRMPGPEKARSFRGARAVDRHPQCRRIRSSRTRARWSCHPSGPIRPPARAGASLHRDALRQVARLVDVSAARAGRVVRQQLQRHHVQDG